MPFRWFTHQSSILCTPSFDGLHTDHFQSARQFNRLPTVVHSVTLLITQVFNTPAKKRLVVDKSSGILLHFRPAYTIRPRPSQQRSPPASTSPPPEHGEGTREVAFRMATPLRSRQRHRRPETGQGAAKRLARGFIRSLGTSTRSMPQKTISQTAS